MLREPRRASERAGSLSRQLLAAGAGATEGVVCGLASAGLVSSGHVAHTHHPRKVRYVTYTEWWILQ